MKRAFILALLTAFASDTAKPTKPVKPFSVVLSVRDVQGDIVTLQPMLPVQLEAVTTSGTPLTKEIIECKATSEGAELKTGDNAVTLVLYCGGTKLRVTRILFTPAGK